MKKIITLIIVILAIVIVASIAKDVVIKGAVENGVKAVTGMKLRIGAFHAGVINALIDIKNLKLYNPPAYKDETMLDIPEIYIRYDLPAILKKNIHLPEVRIDMKELVVVKNEKGELNLDSLKSVQEQKSGQKPKGKAPQIAIDSLEIKLGKVIFKDYSRGASPSVREFNINVNEKFTNITDPYSIVSIIIVKSLMNTPIAALTKFDIKGLQGSVKDTLASAQKVAGGAALKVQETAASTQKSAQQAAEQTKAAAQKAQQSATEAQKSLQEQMKKLPFGAGKE